MTASPQGPAACAQRGALAARLDAAARWASLDAPAWVTLRRVRWALRGIIVAAAAAQAWWFRAFMNPDGVSYLDVGDAFIRRDWPAALSTYWSALYSLLLGLANAAVRPGPALEWPLVHAVNVVTLLLALAAFELLVDAVLAGTRGESNRAPTFGDLLVVFVGYSCFASGALNMASVSLVTPDHLVAAAAYLLAALVERLRVRGATVGRALGLGCVAGAAVLAKAIMLPVGALFVLASWTSLGRGRSRVQAAALVLVGFVMTSGAYVTALSLAHGHLTTGDAGRLNYAWHVNRIRACDNYQGEDGLHGKPVHPTRLISTHPRAFEFAGPIGGTYPVWLDPGYWYEGVTTVLDVEQQLAALKSNFVRLPTEVLSTRALLAALAVLLLTLVLDRRARARAPAGLLARAGVWLPALGAMGSYMLVLLTGRYAAPFVTLLLLPMAAALASERRASRLALLALALAVAVGWLRIYAPRVTTTQVTEDADIALRLSELGLRQGDPIAFVGRSYGAASFARLARLRIIAEVPEDEAGAFWAADEGTQARVLAAFGRAGARAVLATAAAAAPPWTRVGSTSTYYRWLTPPAGQVPAESPP